MKSRIFVLIIIFLILLGIAGCSGGGSPANDTENNSVPDIVQDDSAQDSTQSDTPGDNIEESVESEDEPGAAFQDLDGNTVALSDFKGEIVVLNFWASWCPPCRMEMPDLNDLDKEFKQSGEAVLITVNLTDGQRETEKTARQFIEENGFGFTVLLDDQGILAYQYNISAIPQTFILDRDGNVSGSIIGATTANAILDIVNAAE